MTEIIEFLSNITSIAIIIVTALFCAIICYTKLRNKKYTRDYRQKILENTDLQAKCAHDIWSHWTRYQFSVCEQDEHGNLIIPKEKVERWKRQSQTEYEDLSETEKESDRNIAKQFIRPILDQKQDS